MATDRVIYPPVTVEQAGETVNLPNPADRILTWVAAIAALFALASLAVAAKAWCSAEVGWIYAVIPLWILGPPIWFWCDYFLIYRKYGDPDAFDSFKHAQQISLAIWAAVALLLAGLASADHFKTERKGSAAYLCKDERVQASTPAPPPLGKP